MGVRACFFEVEYARAETATPPTTSLLLGSVTAADNMHESLEICLVAGLPTGFMKRAV